MLSKFAEGVGGKLGDRAAALVFTPAFAFWAGGLAMYVLGGHSESSVEELQKWFGERPAAVQIGLMLAALLLTAAFGVLVQWLTLPFLQIVEGYGPLWPRRLREWSRARQVLISGRDELRWQDLASRESVALTAEDRLEYLRLDDRLHRVPVAAADYMPTRLGNILRASELRVDEKYGLEISTTWPRLWLVLPETVRVEVSAARSTLNGAVGVVLWGLLFLAWAPLNLTAVFIGIIVAFGGWKASKNAARTFGDLVESAFDLHRTLLYVALRRRPPISPAEERAAGQALSTELLRGAGTTAQPYVVDSKSGIVGSAPELGGAYRDEDPQ